MAPIASNCTVRPAMSSIVTGVFKEIEKRAQTGVHMGLAQWGQGGNPETVVALTLTPRDGGTDLELVQTGFLQEEFRLGCLEDGWTSAFRSLEASLSGKPAIRN